MPQQLPLIVYHQTGHLPASRLRLCDPPAEERPLYRLHHHGSDALATAELLALVLGTAEAPGIADELLTRCGSLHQLARTSKEQLMRICGIGETQAGQLVAMLELSRRLQVPPADERPRVTSPADAAALLTPRMVHLEQEELWVVLLDTRNRVWSRDTLSRRLLPDLVKRSQRMPQVAEGWAAQYVLFARKGFTDALQQEAAETGVMLISLQQIGTDLALRLIYCYR